LPYNLTLLDTTAHRTLMGNTYWGNVRRHWYDNSVQYTLLAYHLIEDKDSNDRRLPAIRDYFLELRTNSQLQNTVEKASVLETILPSLLGTPKEKVKPVKMRLEGDLKQDITEFPFFREVDSASLHLRVSKSGTGAGYFTVYQEKWNSDPKPVDSLYEIRSAFYSEGQKLDQLKAGVPAELRVSIEVKEYGEYVMIEIPIPAGCSYGDNTSVKGPYEVHREYFRQKVSVFCEKLPPGKYTFSVNLEPRFSGNFTLNPAKAELMYFPTFYGRNEMKKMKIKNN
jgi:uncharacterized protein YfaS (alpha-2-macroglobulin family)